MDQPTQHFNVTFDKGTERNNKGFKGRGAVAVMGNHVLMEGKVPAHIAWKLGGGFMLFLILGTITEIIDVQAAGPDHSPITVLLPLIASIFIASTFSKADKIEFTTDKLKDFNRKGNHFVLIASTEHASWVVSFYSDTELEAKQIEQALSSTGPDLNEENGIDRSKHSAELTFEEAAEYLGISTDKLHSLAMGGYVKCILERASFCFKKEVLDEYLKSLK